MSTFRRASTKHITEILFPPRVGLYSRVPAAVAADKRLWASDLRTLAALCKFADRRGRCFPSHNRLADMLGMARRQVQRSLTRLRRFGWISWERRFRRDGRGLTSNLYQIFYKPLPERGDEV
jgi:hypothetical protein